MRLLPMLLVTASVCLAQNPLTESFVARYNSVKQNLIESAAAMPEDQYSYKLTPAQRSFGDWIGHTVMLNQGQCSAAKGVATPPMDHSKHSASASKAELQRSLKESFDLCDAVWKEMTDQKALAQVDIGGKKSYPVAAMMTLLANLNSHYGNLVGYMRTKGIVPPSTARSMKK